MYVLFVLCTIRTAKSIHRDFILGLNPRSYDSEEVVMATLRGNIQKTFLNIS
jgi:hypothetical protein